MHLFRLALVALITWVFLAGALPANADHKHWKHHYSYRGHHGRVIIREPYYYGYRRPYYGSFYDYDPFYDPYPYYQPYYPGYSRPYYGGYWGGYGGGLVFQFGGGSSGHYHHSYHHHHHH